MKAKPVWVVVAAVFVAGAGLVAVAQTLGSERKQELEREYEIGRYKLFQGSYLVVVSEEDAENVDEETHHSNGLFRIDSVTGKTWEYRVDIIEPQGGKGQTRELHEWVPLDNEKLQYRRLRGDRPFKVHAPE